MNTEELKKIVNNFNKTKILVIGDLMLDRFINGEVSRISPEAPVPVVDVTSENFRLGGAGNAISNIRTLGGNVVAVGVVGDDWYGLKLIYLLEQNKVNTDCVIISKDRPTTLKTRVVSGQQHILRIDWEKRDAINSECTKTILDYLHKIIGDLDALFISDYDKGVVTNELLKELIALAKKSKKPVVVYPKVEHLLDYKGVNIIITNLQKASAVTGINQINDTSIRNMGQWLLTHLECDCVLITRGKEGMLLFEKNGSVTNLTAIAREVRDETGAGDTVSSIFALSLASRVTDMKNIATLANIAAGIVVGKFGETTVTKDELKHKICS